MDAAGVARARRPAPAATRDRGRLSAETLEALLRELAARDDGRTVVVELRTELGDGGVTLDRGLVVDARCGAIVGAGAIVRLLQAERGDYRLRGRARPGARRLNASPQRVLEEGARFKDAWHQLAGDRLPPTTRLAVDRARLEGARDQLDLEALGLLARLDGSKPLLDIVDLEAPDAARQFERLRALIGDGLARVVAIPAAVRESAAMTLTRSVPALREPPDAVATMLATALAKIYARHVLVGNSAARTLVRAAAVALLLSTLALALVRGRWELAVGGQLMGWALLVLGHSVTRRPELMYAFPSALLLEPVMVIAQALERVGLRPGFVARGRHIARQALSS